MSGAMVHRKLPDLPGNPAPFVPDLRTARQAAINVQMAVRPFSPCYIAADDVRAAVDRLAEMLTGDPTYFHGEGTSGGGSTLQDKLAREQGRLPWSGASRP